MRHALTGVWVMPDRRDVGDQTTIEVPNMDPPPLNAEYLRVYEAAELERARAEAKGEPLVNERTMCLPDGVPKMLSTTFPIEILETPGKVTLIAEFNTQVRHIYLDQKSHPPPDEVEFNFFGHSIGQWEGVELVVDTIGLRDSTELFERVPHSEELRVVERFRFVEPDVLSISITMIDPLVFTEPWTIVRIFERRDDVMLREFVCAENNRHYGTAQGTIGTEASCE
jgi:hypothetical protein